MYIVELALLDRVTVNNTSFNLLVKLNETYLKLKFDKNFST